MANLRRTKLKAKRVGCDVIKIDKCTSKEEVEAIVSKLNKKSGANHDVSE